jgi:iron complex outermembrane recepter protein
MNVDDEILPETIDNVTVYRNVARATHTGLELSRRTRVERSTSIEGSYAYSRFILDDFGIFSGNRLPGIPAHLGTVRASHSHRSGWDGYLSLVMAGKAYVNDANLEAADGYAVVGAGAGYRFRKARLFLRAETSAT